MPAILPVSGPAIKVGLTCQTEVQVEDQGCDEALRSSSGASGTDPDVVAIVLVHSQNPDSGESV